MKSDDKSNIPTPARPNRIKEQREKSRLTQKELAKLMDIDFTTISKHESGNRGPTPEEVKKYAQIFKCQSYEIFFSLVIILSLFSA